MRRGEGRAGDPVNLLAVDPGLRNPAVAISRDGKLVAASRIKIPAANHKLDMGQRCLNVARLIADYAKDTFDEIVVEWPKIYRGAKSKGDPADLFPLSGVGLAVAGIMLGRNPNVSVVAPTAHDWIGSLPKSTTAGDVLTSPRGQRIWSRLSEEERAVVVVSHDAVDAAGILLWRLGRLERVRSFIGAT